MEFQLLKDIVIILGLSVLIILVLLKLKIPTIIGFLVTGIIAGPYGLNLIKSSHEVELLSEIGIIFLLFVIGIEFSLKGMLAIKSTVLWGGLMQVGGTICATALITYLFGFSINEAVFLGFLFALSSTAIVLKILQEKGESSSPHGRILIAILIFQDLVVVPMMLITPILAGQSDELGKTVFLFFCSGSWSYRSYSSVGSICSTDGFPVGGQNKKQGTFLTHCGCNLFRHCMADFILGSLIGTRGIFCRTHYLSIRLQPPGDCQYSTIS